MKPWTTLCSGVLLVCTAALAAGPKKDQQKKPSAPSVLDQYLKSASAPSGEETPAPGAIWSASSRLDDLAEDLRARRINDVVTIVVTETINAAATGASTTERASSANASVTSLAGPRSPTGSLANLLNQTGDQKLNGTGTTTRTTTLNACGESAAGRLALHRRFEGSAGEFRAAGDYGARCDSRDGHHHAEHRGFDAGCRHGNSP
jgi:flagellar basal body L-ring protein FlgH